ncbi:MAG: hypothetical protein Rubg2KO_31560 [Rubricoccaceae bacterium]
MLGRAPDPAHAERRIAAEAIRSPNRDIAERVEQAAIYKRCVARPNRSRHVRSARDAGLEAKQPRPIVKRYLSYQTPARRFLRSHGTHAEAVLWLRLKNRQLERHRFRRQYGIGPYILDFCCPAVGLAIELDGAVHDMPSSLVYDAARTDALADEGLRVLRFENRRVFEDLEGVLEEIAAACAAGSPPDSARTR